MPTNWFVKSGTGGTTGADWANACNSISALLTNVAVVGGDTIYCHNTHAAGYGASTTLTIPEATAGVLRVLSVDGGDATGASLSGATVGSFYPGAKENTTGSYNLDIRTPGTGYSLYFYGMTFEVGLNTSSTCYIYVNNGGGQGGHIVFDKCTFTITAVSNRTLTIGRAAGMYGQLAQFLNCTFNFTNTGQAIEISAGVCEFVNCTTGGTAPTSLFRFVSQGDGIMRCHGCDWSASTNVLSQNAGGTHQFFASNCRIATPVTGTHQGPGASVAEFHACAPEDTSAPYHPDILNYYYEDASGVVEDKQDIYLTTGGAQAKDDDGTATSYSLQMTPREGATFLKEAPLYTPWFYAYVGSTGSKTVTVKCADTEAAVLKDTELFMEVEYVGDAQVANSPQSQRATTAPVVSGTISRDVTAAGSNMTDTAEAWTGIAETGTYTLSETVTIDEYGYIRCRVGLAKDTTNPVYVDPKITVS